MNEEHPYIVKIQNASIDKEYIAWIEELKKSYRTAQIKSALRINVEQLSFYWKLGGDLVRLKAEEKWGSGIVEQVSLDLQNAFPGEKGFSATNLWYMKKWFLFYSEGNGKQKLAQFVREIEKSDNQINKKLAQIVRENKTPSEIEFPLPPLFCMIPWGHHRNIVTKCDTVEEALFYMVQTLQYGWSRDALYENLKNGLYSKQGNAITNFQSQLPINQSVMAQQILKDPYSFDFVSLPNDYDELQLETALEQNITRFLLELGNGFAFVGRQKEIVVAGKTRRIDMLFYHIKLRCYIVCELKAKSFEPEFVGKLNFYVNAVDELLKSPEDNPTIGLLICKSKNDTEVQWAFKGVQTPVGVASYENIRNILPSAEELQNRIQLIEDNIQQQ